MHIEERLNNTSRDLKVMENQGSCCRHLNIQEGCTFTMKYLKIEKLKVEFRSC